ncbi:MAG: formate dehydrogenase accessory sulfurtransferase FdhD [Thermoleophilia bacterium]|nr:formate dehydrogenase accessory sulfurtransferase FdhD [Thermoleophilia bacterium]
MSASAPRRQVLSVRGDERRVRRDRLAAEEPMEIRVTDPSGVTVPVAVTMRTPGDDFALAAGFLVTEGVVEPGSIRRVAYCDDVEGEQLFNVVTVTTTAAAVIGEARRVAATSACGICGTTSLDEVEVRCAPLAAGPVLTRGVLLGLPGALRAGQRVFDQTGGLHAAGLFDPGGALLCVREDIGRHNAVDKVVGVAALDDALPLADRALMVSGRAGFEIVQKAAVAGIGLVASVSAPSSLAADAAERFGLTLVGFLRGDGYNVYTHPERILG